MGKGKESEKSEHVAQPLSSLKDPSSFAPPPKHVNYHGAAALPNETTPDRRGLGAPLSQDHIERQRAAAEAEQEAAQMEAEKPKPPPVPYRVNTTGLSTNNLPPPPVRRLDSPSTESPSTTKPAIAKPKPQLPPRLPPRNASPAQDPSPPPAYSAVSSPPAPSQNYVEGHVNQQAASNLARAGISVPGLGIGGNTAAPQPASTNDAPVDGMQSRFSQMRTNSGSPSTSTTPQLPNRASRPVQSTEGLAPLPGFRDRHADTIDAGKKKFGGMTSRLNTFVEDRKFSSNANKRVPRPPGPNSPATPISPARNTPVAAPSTNSPAPVSGSLEAQAKKKPPPPPPKRADIRAAPTAPTAPTSDRSSPVSSSPAPPPVPLSTKPR